MLKFCVLGEIGLCMLGLIVVEFVSCYLCVEIDCDISFVGMLMLCDDIDLLIIVNCGKLDDSVFVVRLFVSLLSVVVVVLLLVVWVGMFGLME